MPINMTIGNPSQFDNAFLDYAQPLDEVIENLPGLLGAWDASDYTGAPWLPRIGSNGQIILAAADTPAVPDMRDGQAVIHFSIGSKAFINDGAGNPLSLSGLTFGSRAYYSNTVTNFQKLFDLGGPELFFRSTAGTPIWQFANLGTAGSTPIQLPLVDWHTVVFGKNGTDEAKFLHDGMLEVGFGSASTAMSGLSLVLGDARNATSAECDLKRLIICSSGDLTTDQRQAVASWING